jgi:hypothetical protein
MFPPGRASVLTSFIPTGSFTNTKIIGMVEVACLAYGAVVLPTVTIAATFNDASSAAICRNRSGISFGKRCSNLMLRPST